MPQPPGQPEPSPRRSWVRRHKIATALLSALALIVVIIVASVAGSSGGKTPAPKAAGITAPTAAPAAAVVTDPSGNTCAALDAAGYCPGNDPTTAPPTP